MFIEIPSLDIVTDRPGLWRLAGKLVFYSQVLNKRIEVEEGFNTDLASIPRAARLLIPVNGLHRAAAIIHDKLYSAEGELEQGDDLIKYSRKTADLIFYEAMKCSGVNFLTRNAMYAAVRIAVWNNW